MTGLVQKHINFERCSKNLKLPNRLEDQKLIDLNEEMMNFYEKHDNTTMTQHMLRLFCSGSGQTWRPTDPGTSEGQQSFASDASKL